MQHDIHLVLKKILYHTNGNIDLIIPCSLKKVNTEKKIILYLFLWQLVSNFREHSLDQACMINRENMFLYECVCISGSKASKSYTIKNKNSVNEQVFSICFYVIN